MGKELSRPAVVLKKRDFRLRHGYAGTRWRGKHFEFGLRLIGAYAQEGRLKKGFVFSLTRSCSSLEHTENSERIIFCLIR
jgi:hypothetical protein